MKAAPLFAGIGGHHSSRSTTDEWLTPPAILIALGGQKSFDLDPCAPRVRPWGMARHHYTIDDNGLNQRWFGRVWLNPPYGRAIGAWLGRMSAHGRGTALIFARTETEAFVRHVWRAASGLLFIAGRLDFLRVDGTPMPRKRGKGAANSGAPSVLVAYGGDDLDILAASGIDGQLVPLRLPRGIVIPLSLQCLDNVAPAGTWRDHIVQWLHEQRGPVALDELYRAFSAHPKARRNPNYRAKIRQVLQHGAGRRVARGQWCAA